MLDNLYRQVILDHYKNKKNFEELRGDGVLKVHYKNPTCGDVMNLYLKMDNGDINKAAFLGEGCSISMASASMMTELIKDKSLQEVANLRAAMENLIRQGKIPESIDLGDSLSLQDVHTLRARHNCALMTWQALDRILKDHQEYTNFL
ncbi:Fe-S cluster assembly sulfur transfer protein SufU [Rossellomorea sp. BNER]|uniref:Fe-S cluster assembly sulfur transfer protein SufU n=1 Tax=Rossellomorea sp. BNER TaxID=2962031 RepID=UPI003AF24F8E|nr:SUF system NifU family Fe-S cluster assembly protein [Rossellomorea sp. BNER]